MSSDFERDIFSLEDQARNASPGYETQFLNRAGNVCMEAGQPARAMRYYGRAIDSYLESGRFNAAEVLCRKVIQVSPEVVRARGTLAWLALGKGFFESACEEIAAYVAAAKRARQHSLATAQLTLMAAAAPDVELREGIARHLLDLGALEEADHVYGRVLDERNGLREPRRPDEARLWSELLRAVLMGPRELEQQHSHYAEADLENVSPFGYAETASPGHSFTSPAP